MNESKITTIFKGEFVQVDLVDETIELTVEDNVYSRSESLELLEELKRACAANGTVGEPLDSKSKLYDKIGVPSSGCNVVGGMITYIGGVPVDWTFHTTDDDCEFEDTGRVD